MLSGFTIVRNAVKLDFPIVAAIRSVLEVCDEVVVNVGKSEDETRDLVASIGDPRIRILDSEWDFTKRNFTLSIETQRAMDACRGPWGIYIQADEVLHETGAAILKARVAEWDGDERVEGLLVDYLHFYGGFDTVATSRRWYRREVRCVRLGKGRDIRPYQGAQGFRVGDGQRRIRARVTGARMFHYGWARPAQAIRQKLEISKTIYPWGRERLEEELKRRHLEWIPLLRPFTGEHPRAAREWIAARTDDPERVIGPRHFKLEHLRFYVSDWIERLTGARVFEFRNYELA
jgi:glycosyltransferase involved in cell wall biosynthesis